MKDTRDLIWTPFAALVKKEIRRFVLVIGQTVMTPIINSSLYLMIFGVSLGNHLSDFHGFPYLYFLIPGLVMMSALNNSYQNVSSSIVGSRFHGDLQDLKLMPIQPSKLVWALSVGALVRGLSVGTITLIVSEIFSFFSRGELFPILNPGLFLFFLIVGSLSFAQIGMIVGFSAKNFEQLNAVSSFILVPLLYLGGVFFSVQTLHPFWQNLSLWNPLFYFINGTRYGCLGISDVPLERSLVLSVVFLVVLHLLARISVVRGHYGRW